VRLPREANITVRCDRRRRGFGHARRAAGMAESVLLLLLHQEPAHGYTLLEGLREFGLDGMDPSAVYRTLRDMEDRGWVTSSWNEQETLGPPRRVYRITTIGDDVLAAWIQSLDETRKMLDRLVSRYNAHMEKCEGEHYPRAAETKPQEAE
jgi:PadR family transcriptional regulator